MSTHIEAKVGDIAPIVLLPGDPLRAKFIAESYLEGAACYNRVRGMLGYTGKYKGKSVSVQGTGMGQPSISIYATELMREYKARILIRVGTIGALDEKLGIGDLILAQAAASDSAINATRFGGLHYAPIASFDLLCTARNIAQSMGLPYTIGEVASSDLFYSDIKDYCLYTQYGIKGVEMETAELYTLGARYKARALAILTVSDNILTKVASTSEEREQHFTDMMKLALETAVKSPL